VRSFTTDALEEQTGFADPAFTLFSTTTTTTTIIIIITPSAAVLPSQVYYRSPLTICHFTWHYSNAFFYYQTFQSNSRHLYTDELRN